MGNRTQEALRQCVNTTLTTPPLTYQIDMNGTNLVPAEIIPAPIWNTGGQESPAPLVAYTVSEHSVPLRTTQHRAFSLRFVIVSTLGTSECVAIYEKVRARFHLADSESLPDGPTDISRVASSANLGVAIIECKFKKSTEPDFDDVSKRYYMSADFDVVAI